MIRYLTAGESHGKALVTIIDGIPAGLRLDERAVNNELARRQIGYGRGKRMKIEKDRAEIISGLRKGVTIGSPVAILINNKDFAGARHAVPLRCPRPGHADLAGLLKYGFNDARNVLERSSARETAARVGSGAVAKLLLGCFGVRVFSHVLSIGKVEADTDGLSLKKISELAERSDLRCADGRAAAMMREEIDGAAGRGDTLGGSFEVIAEGVCPGLGSYAQYYRRLDGKLALAVMSIQAVKAVSIGKGFESAFAFGSEVHDEIRYDKKKRSFVRDSNNAGGLEGGVTNGSPVVVRGFMKPIATLASPLETVNIRTKRPAKAAVERADVTAVPACGVVAEAAVALELASAFLEKFGGDSVAEIRRNYDGYLEQVRKT